MDGFSVKICQTDSFAMLGLDADMKRHRRMQWHAFPTPAHFLALRRCAADDEDTSCADETTSYGQAEHRS